MPTPKHKLGGRGLKPRRFFPGSGAPKSEQPTQASVEAGARKRMDARHASTVLAKDQDTSRRATDQRVFDTLILNGRSVKSSLFHVNAEPHGYSGTGARRYKVKRDGTLV